MLSGKQDLLCAHQREVESKACIGRQTKSYGNRVNGKLSCAQVREYLEKSYEETEGANTVKLAVKALMEVVEAGSKNLEIAVMEKDTGENSTCLCQCLGRDRNRVGSVHLHWIHGY